MTNTEGLDNMNFDVLTEIGNIGAGNAVTALSQMINAKVDMYVPQVKMLTFQQLANVIGGEETLVAGIMLSLEGDIEGSMLFMLGSEDAHRLVEQLLGMKPQADDTFSEMEMSALSEVGNIIAGSYLSALSALTGLTITASIPYTSIDMAGALLSLPAIEYGKIGDKVLLIETQFGEEVLGNGYFVMIPELESYEKILTSLGL